ncbi:hypothetical protein EI427_21625 [Flammeovirga pectinis]|uniref:Tox-MPTase2 domain-containing protein n=1 Tax=Flammeovirga pectinis TaxID=2494373 RepID=A0A3Q9FQM5_9BACT|nr:hypothetical protein [Flammeovirga pectinis]AZQ64828.1 hypothetical protein EI427_21625 [Flammeovirga pectinis]
MISSDVLSGGIIFNDKIEVNTKGGGMNKLLNTASNIKNTLVHEYNHQKDTREVYDPYTHQMVPNVSEKRAIVTQKKHSSWNGTTSEYKMNVNKYSEVHEKK